MRDERTNGNWKYNVAVQLHVAILPVADLQFFINTRNMLCETFIYLEVIPYVKRKTVMDYYL
jgi:hypothetical protein